MRVDELDYDLPERLIAQYPPKLRAGGRMLALSEQGIAHRAIEDLLECVPRNALLVLNDTRVMRARLFGRRRSNGGRVELLLLARAEGTTWLALARAKRPLSAGERLDLGDAEVLVLGKSDRGALLVQCDGDFLELMERHGHVPLPPYVRRVDEALDQERYQTVFARHLGSAAAPTAGLHLSKELLERLEGRGVELGFVTLHVGIGTFRPVSAPTLSEHPMHRERFSVSAGLVEQIRRARARMGPVIAVGTTVVRALESAAGSHGVEAMEADTGLLIAPGYPFSVVDGLLTNFHAPRSTLLALVYAFAGQDRVRAAYRVAIEQEYRFLSYGDAMWIPRRLP